MSPNRPSLMREILVLGALRDRDTHVSRLEHCRSTQRSVTACAAIIFAFVVDLSAGSLFASEIIARSRLIHSHAASHVSLRQHISIRFLCFRSRGMSRSCGLLAPPLLAPPPGTEVAKSFQSLCIANVRCRRNTVSLLDGP